MAKIAQAREWTILADMDLKSAEYLQNMYPVPIEIICYHCQQSAEKYLKGFLVLHNINPPKIHDLDVLCKLCKYIADSFDIIADQCSDLTAFGIQPRYPTDLILEEQDMKLALESAKIIRDFIHSIAPEMYTLD
jgi:HEPN domain-containing protein